MPLLCLINALRGPVPPDGYRYVDPEDGWVNHSFDYRTWVEDQEKHLRANNRPVPHNLNEIMEDQLCRTLPPGWCRYDDPNRERPVLVTLEWTDVMNAASVFKGWVQGGMKLVSQDEADRRAKICANCYLNVLITGCSQCQAIVAAMSEGLTSRHDAYLRSCAACKCNLKAKVHFPMEALDKENPGVQKLYPEHCWRKHNGPNTLNVSD